MTKKVLITGASGFVGFHLIEAAVAQGLEVYAAVRKSSDISHLKGYNIHYTYLNFTSIDTLISEIEEKQYNYIIHAAGVTKAPTQQDYNLVNAEYTINLAKAIIASKSSLEKLVFVSSLAALGPLATTDELITEGIEPKPVTAYGKSKLLAEERLQDLKLPLIVLRPTAVYGPREKDIFIVLKTIAKGFDPYIGRINQQLSFVYVKDLARVTIEALTSERIGTYNISDGNCYSRYEMANITKKVLNKTTLRVHLPLPVVKVLASVMEKSYSFTTRTPALNIEKLNELTALNWCCNMEKAKAELGFEAQFNLQKGLKETLDWYKENKWL